MDHYIMIFNYYRQRPDKLYNELNQENKNYIQNQLFILI